MLAKKVYWRFRLLSLGGEEYFPGRHLKNTRKFYQEKDFGAPDHELYQLWKQQVCAIASLKMITDYLGKTSSQTLYQMSQESLVFGTFEIPKKIERPDDIKGIFHKGLEKYIQSFGLDVLRDSMVPIERVIFFLSEGWLFLGSINYYEMYNEVTEGPGKHIVLVIGASKEKEGWKIYFKDPSWGREKETEAVSEKIFLENFNHRGLFIKLKTQNHENQ